MTPSTPPTGAAGDVGKTLPRPSGRRALPCLAVIPATRQLCILHRQHQGTHLPPARWCAVDITETNPSVRSSK